MPAPQPSPSGDVIRLSRWVDAGGTWRLLARTTTTHVTVALLTCDGGEEMERFDSSDPALLERASTDVLGRSESRSEPAAEEGA